MKGFGGKWKKPHFGHFGPVLGTFGPKWTEPEFFSKIGLRHFLVSTKVHLHAKNHKKLMSGFREKWLHTDARTDRGEFIGPSRLKAGGPKMYNLNQ